MNHSEWIRSITLAIIGILSTIGAYAFYRTKNGVLRKIMIAFLSSLALRNYIFAAYVVMDAYKTVPYDEATVFMYSNIPLALTLACLIYYIYRSIEKKN